MSTDPLDLPVKKIVDRNPEVLSPVPRREFRLTERQLDELIKTSGQVTRDLGEIFKGLVSIAEIRTKTEHEVAKIEAETRRIEIVARAEIDRTMALERNIHTRAEAAHKILVQLTEMIKLIPEADPSSRGRLIDTLSSILDTVLHEKT